MNRWILPALAILAAVHGAPPASAQAPTREGYSLPMMYDWLGAQHFYANGYAGDMLPPMVPRTEANSVRRGGLSSLDARARAGVAGARRTKQVPPR
jgi:hypothetical protein